ncbi:hypothetical protein llap_2024 [Limosa lapponica baueri]|uniref:Uncharacterized protein n=1 Tax=Limosa lapponica baueri TaxID=1758121 RepID=A0A2I0UNV0_LIMLA|nr:hypothetical protein llap_2024 [Limosa lapponica baueri]
MLGDLKQGPKITDYFQKSLMDFDLSGVLIYSRTQGKSNLFGRHTSDEHRQLRLPIFLLCSKNYTQSIGSLFSPSLNLLIDILLEACANSLQKGINERH